MALTTGSRALVDCRAERRSHVCKDAGTRGRHRAKLRPSGRSWGPGSHRSGSDLDTGRDTATTPAATPPISADVLVIDDEADVRWTMAEVLRSAGFSVAEAEDGDIAFRMLSAHRYRMILLDIRMPKRDGVSLVEALDTVPPVVVHSAYSLDASERERLGSSVVGYLDKPVSPQKLLRAVESVLGDEHGR